MAEHISTHRHLHHRTRFSQVPIYLGKRFRGFVFMNDWKVLPMAAIIAALVSMVIRKNMFVNMEGTLMGAFALTCVGIWNGCFNSIQVICRERGIIKREHRSGMHISAYIVANMIYQALLCLAQSVLTVVVCRMSGVNFPSEGFITPYLIADIGITVFLVSFASDMLSMLVSCLAHTTTAAMTVMPFILIFQLVFSGGFFTLPSWAQGMSGLTLSRYGMNAICAQSDYNNLPMKAGWTALTGMENETISGTFTLRKATELLTAGTVLTENPKTDEAIRTIPSLLEEPALKDLLDKEFTFSFRVGDILDRLGRDDVRIAVQSKTAAASRSPDYEKDFPTIWNNWSFLILFSLIYALIGMILLEFIDRDKR